MKKRKKGTRKLLLVLLAVAAAAGFFLISIRNLDTSGQQKGCEQLETALRQAAVACYAVEGIYPPDLAYLQTHYGIQIDHSRYAVSYQIFADNLMPDITVLMRKP